MGEGKIPKNTVNATKVNKSTNSRLFKSGTFMAKKEEREPPKATLLYMKIVKAAEKTIEDEARIPKTGILSKAPYKHRNSPTKLTVRGVPEFPKAKIKKSKEKRGIIWVTPL